jgi:hypothetical protein
MGYEFREPQMARLPEGLCHKREDKIKIGFEEVMKVWPELIWLRLRIP